MVKSEDLAIVLELRRHGATRARSGEVEAEWQLPPEHIASPTDQRRPETETERAAREERELNWSSGG